MILEDSPKGVEKLNEALETIRAVVLKWNEKRALILADWLIRKMEYLESEGCYQPKRDNYYKRGQIVHVDFGFNVGSEDGGGRFAVVVWSPQNSKTMTVIPLTSLKKGTTDKASELQVNLGEILSDNTITIAKIQQIRAVSKLRVSRLSKQYKTEHVPGKLMEEINKRIAKYTEKKL